MAISLPVLWVAFEFGRKHAWTIVDATGYPYGQLGLTQAIYPRLIQLADLGGIYAVTGLVAAVNGLVVDVITWLMARHKDELARPPLAAMAAVSAAVSMAWVYGTWRVSQDPAQAGPSACLMPAGMAAVLETIEPGVEQDDGWLSEAVASSGLREEHGGPLRPELLIWSEAVGNSFAAEAIERSAIAITASNGANSGLENVPPVPPGETAADTTTLDRMERFSRRINAALVIGADRELAHENPRYCNSAAVVDPQRGYVGCYDKLRLVPFSEFYPPGRPKFAAGGRDRYMPGRSYPVFEMTAGASMPRYSFAVAICYDTAFPDVFRRFMRPPPGEQLPGFFVVPACEAHDRYMRLQDILLQLARFRAIECRRAFVRNSEGGFSGIIDGNGTLIAAPPEIDFDKPVILGRVPMDDRFSPYVILGDWLPIAAWGAIGIVTLAPLGRRTKALLFPRATNSEAAAEPRATTR